MFFSVPLTFIIFWNLALFSHTLPTPTIKLCSLRAGCLYELKYRQVLSNSTFQFGEESGNEGVVTRERSETYHHSILACEAPYPVRWLTREYNNGIKYVHDGPSLRKNQKPMGLTEPSFIVTLEYDTEDGNPASGYIFRCESFSNMSLAAEIFIRRPTESAQIKFAPSDQTQTSFVVTQYNEGSFVVPCSAKNIPLGEAEDVKLFEADAGSYGNLQNRRELSATYDFRLGFKVRGLPNFRKIYECSSSESVQLLPLHPDNKVESTLIYDHSDHSLVCIIPSSHANMRGIQLVLATCGNITDCDLKFRPTTTLNSMSLSNWKNGIYYGALERSDRALKLKLGNIPIKHGFVQCSGLFEKNPTNNFGERAFTNKIDYLFTGLNGKKYLYSQGFPSHVITKLSEVVDENGRVAYNCKSSPFAIYPNNKHFFIEFQDGELLEIRFNGQYGDSQFKLSKEKLNWQEQLTIKLNSNVKKIMCFAPLMNSSDWARSEIFLYHSPFTSVGAIIGYCALATLLLIIGVVWIQRTRSNRNVRAVPNMDNFL